MAEHGISRSGTWGRTVVALVMTFFAVVATASAAGAADGGAGNGGGGRDFAAQAERLGLSGSEARSLQGRVDTYLARSGGTRVAVDKIRLDGGGELLLALPGERKAREAGARSDARGAAASCPYTYVCAYSGPNFTGDELRLFTCNYPVRIYWSGVGSWINNQRAALRARFYDVNGNVGWTSPGGYSEDRNAPWGWVYWLSPC